MTHNASAQACAATVSWEASEFTLQRADASLARAQQLIAVEDADEGTPAESPPKRHKGE